MKFDKNQPIHIIGGGGVGMSALALLLLKSGFVISASDKNGGQYLDKLANAGAGTWTGSKPENIPANAVIFYSSAVPENDLERLWAVEHKMPVHSRHGLLKAITQQYHTIAISGTHGKTTTTGWIASLLEEAGLDPNALVGGTLVQWNSNVRLGQGKINNREILVIEADESDESFLSIEAQEIIITNIELDHVDRYTDLRHVEDKFQKYIDNCQEVGGVFFPSFEVKSLMKAGMNFYEKIKALMDQISIDEKSHGLIWMSASGNVFYKVGLSGVHNLWNAVAVLAFGLYHDLPQSALEKSLSGFRGVERRMQTIGKFINNSGAEVTVIDDYAHHPTEIKVVLETLVAKYENVIAVWEPHRISRMLHFSQDFQKVFEKVFKTNSDYENIFLMNVFDAAGESKMPEFSHFQEHWKNWVERVCGVIGQKGEYNELMESLHSKKKKTVVVFLGAGNSSDYAADFFKIASEISAKRDI